MVPAPQTMRIHVHVGDIPLVTFPSPRASLGALKRVQDGDLLAREQTTSRGFETSRSGFETTLSVSISMGVNRSLGNVNERHAVRSIVPRLRHALSGSSLGSGAAYADFESENRSEKPSDRMIHAVSDGQNTNITFDEEVLRMRPRLRRSASAQSNLSKTSIPGWVRPVLRRSASAGSTPSGVSGGSKQTSGNDTSAPPGIHLGELRECKSVSIIWDHPPSDNYEFGEKCGEGGFGEVWQCTRRETGEKYAIKLLKAKEKQDIERLVQELKCFERFNCPYLVNLHEVFLDQHHTYLVMDLCTGGDLSHFVKLYQDEPDRVLRRLEHPDQVRGLPTKLVGHFLWQMLVGIAYMHHYRFAHRDIKLQNYVIREPAKLPVLQLVDFGMTTRFQRGKLLRGTMGTVKYMAPEVLANAYSEKCDIWSIGVLCYILCTDRSPWGSNRSLRDVCRAITDNLREPWPPCDKPKVIKNLVETMMIREYEKRPSAKEILKASVWLKQFATNNPNGSPSCCSVS